MLLFGLDQRRQKNPWVEDNQEEELGMGKNQVGSGDHDIVQQNRERDEELLHVSLQVVKNERVERNKYGGEAEWSVEGVGSTVAHESGGNGSV